MITLQIITLLLFPPLISTSNTTGLFQYGFYRDINALQFEGTRRLFGGEPVQLNEYSAVCALTDVYKIVRCTGAILTKYWVLTAAHCVTSKVAFIKFNSRWSNDVQSKSSPVMYMYRHPDYRVIEEDEGRGMDVTLLHHDIGMMRTQYPMTLNIQLSADPILSMKRFNPTALKKEEIKILGFGHKDQDGSSDLKGEELFGMTLQLAKCERSTWTFCICGVTGPIGRSEGGRGVCAGDSGGPVLYRGLQIAVTSMGPTQCKKLFSNNMHGSTSVFTTLYQYATLINSTIEETEVMLREQKPPDKIVKAKEEEKKVMIKSKCSSSALHYIVFWLSILLCIVTRGIEHL